MTDPSNKKIILLAEDDTDDRELFCEAIASIKDNTTVNYAENGKEALNKLEEMPTKPNMIFLDINMPVMNGWQCLKTLKEDERYKHIPVVIYSSSSNHREREIAKDMGASLFFTKPNDFYVFKEKLEVIINSESDERLKQLSSFN